VRNSRFEMQILPNERACREVFGRVVGLGFEKGYDTQAADADMQMIYGMKKAG
jgi:hypothetical protein